MKCISCEEIIPQARLKAAPGTKECVGCSTEDKVAVQTIISGKNTYSEIEVIKNKETQKDIERITGRGRSGFGSMLYKGGRGTKEFTDVKLIKRDYIPAANTRIGGANAIASINKKIEYFLDILGEEKGKRRSLRYIKEELEERGITLREYNTLKAQIEIL